MHLRSAWDVGAMLRSARKARGLTQAQAAARIGSTQRWVSVVENGHDSSPLSMVLALMNALDIVVTAQVAGPDAMEAARETLSDTGNAATVQTETDQSIKLLGETLARSDSRDSQVGNLLASILGEGGKARNPGDGT